MVNLSIFQKEKKELVTKTIFKKKFRLSKVFLNLLTLLTVNSADAQIIKWNFDDGKETALPSQNVNHVSTSKLSRGNNYGTTTVLITTTSPSSGYSGSSGNYNAGAAAVSAGFGLTTSTYFEFTLTPEEGYSLSLNIINFGSRSTGTGPQSYSIRSSVDAYNSEVASNSFPADSKWYLYQHTGLSVLSGSSITFRIYGFNGVGASQNTAVWRIDDLSLSVTVSAVQTYYRSHQSGNWGSPSTWEYSTDNVYWNISTNSPTKDVENILIQPNHNVIVNSSVSLDQTTIAGLLELQTGGILNINDGDGDDLTISPGGCLKITSSDNCSASVNQSQNANINVSTNGKITIGDGSSFTGDGYEGFATSATNVWKDGSVYEYNSTGIFPIANLTYFPNAASSVIPILRITKVNGTSAAGSGKDFHLNGLFELSTDITFSGVGKKYFRNGIRGTASLTQLNAGKFYLDNPNAVLDGTSLKLVLAQPIDLGTGSIVPIGANVTVSGSNISNSSGTLTINGTLDLKENTITNSSGLVILNGTFRTSYPGGFSGAGSAIPSTTGNINVNPGSTVELYANGNQSLNARSDFSNLIFSGSGIKTPKGPFSPNGTITIKDDAIFDCTGNINGVNIGNENTNLKMTGNSRLIVSTYGPNPPMSGAYNLSGGVVEFKGSNGTPQTIRSKYYQNIEVTGNNVLMSDGNINLNSNGTFTIKNSGVFSINDNTIIGTGDHTQAVKVETGAVFKCGTNMGFNGAAITPIPIKSSAINIDIENIILQPNSTVEYSRNGDQPITNANALVYQNLVISGNGNKTAPSQNLIIQGKLSKSGNANFLHNNGTVIFNGNNPQSYNSVSPQIVFNNLINQNTLGLNINDSLSVYKELLLANNSAINLNADISLLSNKDQTASIGQLGTNANINYGNGRFIIERYINTNTKNGGHLKAWQLISTPAFGETIFNTWQEKGSKAISNYGIWITDKSGTANGFDAVSVAPSMKYYDPVTNSWVGISNTNINLENAKGYLVFVRGDRQAITTNSSPTPTILRTRGKIYTPQFLPPVSSVLPGKFQCVGNPYASVIDFTKINTTNIESSYTAWDPTLGGDYGVGGYQTISAAANYQAVPGNTSNYNTTSDYRNIQSGQAFFVFNYTSLSGSVSFTEACKLSGNQHLVNRKAEQTNGILFANLMTQNNIVLDGNAVSFAAKFSNEIDRNDALKISGVSANFGLKRAGKLLSVEARQEITISDTIFYSLENLSRQEYNLTFVPEKMQPDFEAYLIDQYLKTESAISLTDTTFVNFLVTEAKESAAPQRFYLIFKVPVAPSASFLSFNIYPKDGNVRIVWEIENENDIENYQVEYSADGINFSNIGIINAKDGPVNGYEFIHAQPKAGDNFYRLRINKSDGKVEYKKVVKVWIPESVSSIEIYPNPVQGEVIELQFTNQSSGKYGLNLYNSIGQKVFSKEVNYSGGNSIQLIRPGKSFIRGIYNLEIVKPNGDKKTLKVWK